MDNDLNIDHSSRLSAVLVCLGAVLLPLGFFWRPAFLLGAVLLGLATALNWSFYRFLARTGGWVFAVASMPLHWLYFLGAASGFALGYLGSPERARGPR